MKATASDPGMVSALERAKSLPAPTPGLSLGRLPVDVLAAYLSLHGLEIVRYNGDELLIRVKRQITLADMAKQLSEIGADDE